MTQKQKEIIHAYFAEQFQLNQSNTLWFVDFILLTKAEQKAAIIAWLNSKKAGNLAAIAALESKKLEAEASLSGANADIDGVIGIL